MTLTSACSGRNYNFRSINVVFWRVLCESARTAAKSRTNHSTNSGKTTKRLDRLAPDLAHVQIHMGMDMRQTKCSSRHKGGTWGRGLEGQQFKSMGKLSDWHQLCFTSADLSGSGHRLNTSRPSITQMVLWRVRVSQIKKSGEAVKRMDRLAPNLAHICRSICEWIYSKKIAPRDTRMTLGGY